MKILYKSVTILYRSVKSQRSLIRSWVAETRQMIGHIDTVINKPDMDIDTICNTSWQHGTRQLMEGNTTSKQAVYFFSTRERIGQFTVTIKGYIVFWICLCFFSETTKEYNMLGILIRFFMLVKCFLNAQLVLHW